MAKKLAVVSANTNIGKALVKEALKRGMDTTVIVVNPNETEATQVITKEVMDITAEDLAPFDAVIDASGVWDADYMARHYHTAMHLCDVLAGTSTQLLIVGGEGADYTKGEAEKWFGAVEHTTKVNQNSIITKWFGPGSMYEGYLTGALAEYSDIIDDSLITIDTLFAALKKRKDVNWIFMDPSCELDTTLVDIMLPYDGYAADMIDEIEYGVHYQQRVGTVCD